MSDNRNQHDDDDDDDALQVLLALTKIVARMNALQPDRHLQATLVRAQRIIDRSMPDALGDIRIQ